MEKLENIGIKTIECAMQHIKIFHAQACKEKRADFAEPCSLCKYAANCDLDWMGNLAPLLDASNITIQLCYLRDTLKN